MAGVRFCPRDPHPYFAAAGDIDHAVVFVSAIGGARETDAMKSGQQPPIVPDNAIGHGTVKRAIALQCVGDGRMVR